MIIQKKRNEYSKRVDKQNKPTLDEIKRLRDMKTKSLEDDRIYNKNKKWYQCSKETPTERYIVVLSTINRFNNSLIKKSEVGYYEYFKNKSKKNVG